MKVFGKRKGAASANRAEADKVRALKAGASENREIEVFQRVWLKLSCGKRTVKKSNDSFHSHMEVLQIKCYSPSCLAEI